MKPTDRQAWRRISQTATQLRARKVDVDAISASWSVLVCCARNEMPRMPAFLAHYRRLGVEHFMVLDNQSDDGLSDYLVAQPDCSVWVADGSYKASNFGMDWCNHLLATHGVGKWCVTVDPDELLVYPHCEQRGLRSLTDRMDAIRQPSLFTVLIDAYGKGTLSQTQMAGGVEPFELCPWFDRFNLTQRYDARTRSYWVQGGVRMRRFFADRPEQAPALNKVPLVRWRHGLRYVSSMHHLNDPTLNCTVMDRPEAVSGALFHFKYVNLLQQKASEEMVRKEHYAGSQEYKAYAEAGDVVLYDPEISVRYVDSGQLTGLGFMQAGTWL
jgi:hypothetical protein